LQVALNLLQLLLIDIMKLCCNGTKYDEKTLLDTEEDYGSVETVRGFWYQTFSQLVAMLITAWHNADLTYLDVAVNRGQISSTLRLVEMSKMLHL